MVKRLTLDVLRICRGKVGRWSNSREIRKEIQEVWSGPRGGCDSSEPTGVERGAGAGPLWPLGVFR